jgi:hypothetical protein
VAPQIKLQFVCQALGYPMSEVPARVLVANQHTAIPYNVLQHPGSSGGGNNLLIFMHDMFDSFHEYLDLLQSYLATRVNLKILVLNMPGQAYTMTHPRQVLDNLFLTEIIDRLLFELCEEGTISLEDEVSLMGIGMGGFILQTFLTYSQNTLCNIGRILLVNSFSRVDSILSETISKSLQVFGSCPEDIKELPYNFYSVMANETPLSQEEIERKRQRNPIQLWGRVAILEGMRAYHDIKGPFQQVIINLRAIHTLRNCIVSLKEADELVLTYAENPCAREMHFLEGGHSVIETHKDSLLKHMESFFLF